MPKKKQKKNKNEGIYRFLWNFAFIIWNKINTTLKLIIIIILDYYNILSSMNNLDGNWKV